MKPIFAKLRLILGLSKEERLPSREPRLGLSRGDVAAIHEMSQHPGFVSWLTAIDTTVNLYAEALLQSRDAAALHETRGVILGLRKAASLVVELQHREHELAKLDEHERAVESSQRSNRAAALYGSPAWLERELERNASAG